MKVGFKKLSPLAKVPTYGSQEAAGADLYSIANGAIWPGERRLVPTGLAIQLPLGFEAQIRPRSGLALKKGVTVLNSPGTIDSDYRGEIKVLLINLSQDIFYFSEGDRIAQMVVAIAPQVVFDEVETLGSTDRGVKGYGSTGVHQNEPTNTP